MISDFTIRHATLADLEAIVKVGQDAFPPHRVASFETEKARLETFPEGFYVLVHNGEIIGKSTGLIIDDITSLEELEHPDPELFNPEGPVYYLGSLGLMKKFQKKGLGKMMVDKHLKDAHKLGKKIFRFTSPQEVEGFYSKLGFKRLTNFESFDLYQSHQAIWEMKLD